MSKALVLLRQYRYAVRPSTMRGSLKTYNDLSEAILEVEELELFKSEHLRLEAELNAILHPNGDGPTAPSFCDLVSYVRNDITPKLCGTCMYWHKEDDKWGFCDKDVSNKVSYEGSDTTYDFGCVYHEGLK